MPDKRPALDVPLRDPVTLTIATATARLEADYGDLVASLAAQVLPDDVIEIIVIDFHGRPPEVLLPGASKVPAVRRTVSHPPKPNPWQGPYRVTRQDMCGIANARNTALCLATQPYIAFLDDRVTLSSTWLEVVARGAKERISAIGGPCDKRLPRPERDFRSRSMPSGGANVGGGWLYGGNYCLPTDWALQVNGCEEGTDPSGYEDIVFGMMLSNAGRRIDYDAKMRVTLERHGRSHPLPRPAGQARIDAFKRRFFHRTRTDPELTPDLTALREIVQRGAPFPLHTVTSEQRHWFDGRPYGEYGA